MNACLAKAALITVLSTAGAQAASADLLTPPADAPKYRVSNLRLEDDEFGRPVMIFDYTRLREGDGRVQVAGRNADGPLEISFAPSLNRASGQVRIGKMPSLRGTYDFEFYLVVPAYWAGQRWGDCLVSNTVRMGNLGRGPSARAWTAEERAAYEKQSLSDTTPETLPEGHVAVGSSDRLVPGMPIKASRYAEWVDAEVLALAPVEKVTIRYADQQRAKTVPRRDWLAVEPDMLSQAASRPDSFRPSMRVLPGGTEPLPRDAMPIDAEIELPRGAPLLLYRTRWETVYVSEDKGIEVEVRYANDLGGTGWDRKRSELAIRRETLDDLSDPEAVKAFADNLPDSASEAGSRQVGGFERIPKNPDAEWGASRGDEYLVTDKDYPIEARIPRGAQAVPKDLELPRGTEVAFCWAWEWQAAAVIEDRGAFVIVKKNDNVSSFVDRVRRDQVIIRDKTVRKLRRTATTDVEDLKKTLRTWTDVSGEHKVEARFVGLAGGKVKLKTDAGRVITLPLAKLSEDDRTLLENIKPKAENPFE